MSNSPTILLVEDNEDDVFAFCRALSKAGFSNPLEIAQDGQKAMDYLAGIGAFADRDQHPIPGIVFLDLKLPYRSGHEVLEWIRQQESLRSLPVVILSGSDEGRDHERANSNGARAYLLKPPSVLDLAELMRDFAVSVGPE